MSAHRAREIFIELVANVPPERWEGRLAELAGEDQELCGKVHALLAAHCKADSFLEQPAAPIGGTVDLPPAPGPAEPNGTEQPGVVLAGRYKLLEQIGEGGFGVVYMAEQQQPVRRTVALKLIKPGMDTRQVVARFEAERQALALMDHPHIARVLDAGATDSGRPYFVMELVKGVPITLFCDENRLAPRERLELFVAVCQAVQHAHQKGIIHRDLKPSNVLVTLHDGVPVVKVIDFGIAKALGQRLTDKTLVTGFAQMIGTPLYMSPEQAELSGLDVDTRSDIYALGVLLYELLTGTTPFDRERLKEASYDEMRRIIREEEPPKPSKRLSTLGQAAATLSASRQSDPKQLGQLMRGELDWIAMKALEKDRNRRYETAGAFAADVQRYLHDEPVLACPPSAGYRLQKFARRNKRALATAALLGVMLLGAVGAVVASALWAADQAKARLQVEAAAKEELERNLYYTHIALAERELSVHKVGRAEELLDRCPEHLRGWEWHYLKRQRYGSLPPLQHTRAIWGLAFSPDSRYLASGTADGTVHVWDLMTRKELLTLEGHKKRVRRLAYSRDGRRLVTADEEGSMIVWEAAAGQRIHALPGHTGAVRSVAFSPDGRHVASGGADHKVRLWDLTTGREIGALTDHTGPVQGLVFSSDGQFLTSVCWDGTVKVWDAGTRQEARSFHAPVRFVENVASSPDGRHLALGSMEGTVKVVDVMTGEEALSLPAHTNAVFGLAFSPGGRRLASAGSMEWTIRVSDATTGHEALTLFGHRGMITTLAFSPDGRLASAGFDRTIRLWDATPLSADETSRQCLTLQGHRHHVYRVAFSPDSQRLASASQDRTVRVWDAASGQELAVFHGHDALVMDVAFCSDGQRLASASWDGTVKVWDVRSGREIHTLPGNAGFARCVAFSPDCRYLASGHHDGTVIVWDPGTGDKIHRFKEQLGALTTVAFSPDSRRLASASGGAWTVKIWDTTTWKELGPLPIHEGAVTGLAFSPNNQFLATCSHSGEVKIWETTSWLEKSTLRALEEGSNQFRDVAFSPDGKRLACGSWDQVKVWNLTSHGEPRSLVGHAGHVLTVAWAPDGKRFASGSGYRGKGEIKIWDTSLWEK